MSTERCPHCGAEIPPGGLLTICPQCQKPLSAPQERPAAAEEGPGAPEQEPAGPEEPPVAAEEPTPAEVAPAAPSAPAEAPAPVPPPESELPPDRIKCPNCGAILYSTEEICWRCSTRVQPAGTVAPRPPEAAPVAPRPSVGTMPPAPPQAVPPAPPAAPTAPPTGVPPGPAPPAPGYIDTPQAPPPLPPGAPPSAPVLEGPAAPVEEISEEARNLGNWALGLGVASVACLCVPLGPVALWMGWRAYQAGARGTGIAGMVFGTAGTLLLLAAIGLGLATLFGGALG